VRNGTILVTGSSGHLGEALVRVPRARGRAVIGLDRKPGPYTGITGDITDRELVREVLSPAAAPSGITGVLHAATLHKPHVISHSKRVFIDVNWCLYSLTDGLRSCRRLCVGTCIGNCNVSCKCMGFIK
jgi:UDP-glucose 4-epimerase